MVVDICFGLRALRDLVFVVVRLQPNTFCVHTLAQNTVLDQSENHTPTFKKESLRVVAITASIHGDHLQPFLPKIINVICKYLKVITWIPKQA
jgi:hypothetical protein